MIFEKGYFRSNNSSTFQKGHRSEILNETRTFSGRTKTNKTTVFLSHKHSDLADVEEVAGLTNIFEDHGAIVYIDTMDYSLPGQTSGETASRIKEIIKNSHKFVLAASKSAIESYWCNWELGIGDTYKFSKHIAIIPIKEKGEKDENYKGNEYLQIYPRLNYNDAFTNIWGVSFDEGYYIEEPANKQGVVMIRGLSDWLKAK